jgi:hypothetical protein
VNEPTAVFLVSDAGRVLLDEVSALPGDSAARVLALRKRGTPADLAAGAVEVADARRRARARFGELADQLFFTRDALAQATSPVVAAYHAAGLSAAPGETVVDLGCGVGMDAIALAQTTAARVLAIDRDPARLIFARANAAACGIPDGCVTWHVGDVTALDWQADWAFWDPSRRTGSSTTAATRAGRPAACRATAISMSRRSRS